MGLTGIVAVTVAPKPAAPGTEDAPPAAPLALIWTCVMPVGTWKLCVLFVHMKVCWQVPPHMPGPDHCPQGSQVRMLQLLWHVAAGVQTGVDAHEQLPHAQLALHVCVPYVLQGCVAF